MGPEWDMLATLLRQARAEMAPNVSREAFAKDRGGSSRIMADLETGARSNYDEQTLINAEVWYGLVPGQIARYLELARRLHDSKAAEKALLARQKAESDEQTRARILDEALDAHDTATQLAVELDELSLVRRTREVAHPGAVTPTRDDADGVMLDLPDEALAGLDEIEREEVIAAARLAALKKAREIRAGGQVGLFTVE